MSVMPVISVTPQFVANKQSLAYIVRQIYPLACDQSGARCEQPRISPSPIIFLCKDLEFNRNT